MQPPSLVFFQAVGRQRETSQVALAFPSSALISLSGAESGEETRLLVEPFGNRSPAEHLTSCRGDYIPLTLVRHHESHSTGVKLVSSSEESHLVTARGHYDGCGRRDGVLCITHMASSAPTALILQHAASVSLLVGEDLSWITSIAGGVMTTCKFAELQST